MPFMKQVLSGYLELLKTGFLCKKEVLRFCGAVEAVKSCNRAEFRLTARSRSGSYSAL